MKKFVLKLNLFVLKVCIQNSLCYTAIYTNSLLENITDIQYMAYKITFYISFLNTHFIGFLWQDKTLVACGGERLAEKELYYFECSRVAGSKKKRFLISRLSMTEYISTQGHQAQAQEIWLGKISAIGQRETPSHKDTKHNNTYTNKNRCRKILLYNIRLS